MERCSGSGLLLQDALIGKTGNLILKSFKASARAKSKPQAEIELLLPAVRPRTTHLTELSCGSNPSSIEQSARASRLPDERQILRKPKRQSGSAAGRPSFQRLSAACAGWTCCHLGTVRMSSRSNRRVASTAAGGGRLRHLGRIIACNWGAVFNCLRQCNRCKYKKWRVSCLLNIISPAC